MHVHQVLWKPDERRVKNSQIFNFMQAMSRRYGFEENWESLRKWSIDDKDAFWTEMLNVANITPTKSQDAACRGSGMLDTQWFPGLELNYAAHLMRYRDGQPAIIAEDERGTITRLTYKDLHERVSLCRSALQACGVQRGDRVAGFVANIPEAIIAMLACASLGAIWSSCSPDFGIKGVLDRFGQIEPKVLFAVDGYLYNGKPFSCLDKLPKIASEIPSIERLVIIPFLNKELQLPDIPNATLWEALLDGQTPRDMSFESLPFDHPLFIMYSSGTTGVPKCIVHGHGGTLLQHMKELMLHCDLRREDTIFYFTTCGWMMWNWVVSSLGVGATLVLYEGSPAFPDLNRLWKLAASTKMSVLGTSPKFLSSCQNADIHPGADHDLSSLRCLLSTGSPLAVENFEWVYQNVKSDLQLSSICGGTDIISCFMLGNPMLPVRAGEIQCIGLGMDVRAYDAQGKTVINEKGELVCTTPFPSQPVGFWNDPDHKLYRKAYFEHYPGVWRHGDYVEMTEHGGVVVYGRSDATLNPGGVRIGTAEIYRIVESIPEIQDSLVVGRQQQGDEEVCLFVVLNEGYTLDNALVQKIRQSIKQNATPRHVPKHIRQVNGIPYTISGKKVELAVARLLAGEEIKNRDALSNPHVLDEYHNLI